MGRAVKFTTFIPTTRNDDTPFKPSVLHRVVDTLWFGNPFEDHDRLEVIEADVRDFDPDWLDGIDSVIHLAGLSNDPTADFAPTLNNECNVLATRGLARLVGEKATREGRDIRFVFASTCSVYYTPQVEGDVNVTPMTADTRLWWLGDVLAEPPWWLWAKLDWPR